MTVTCERILPNLQYPHLKVSTEKATELLPFLDVEIKILDYGFERFVYCKQSNTNCILNYHA